MIGRLQRRIKRYPHWDQSARRSFCGSERRCPDGRRPLLGQAEQRRQHGNAARHVELPPDPRLARGAEPAALRRIADQGFEGRRQRRADRRAAPARRCVRPRPIRRFPAAASRCRRGAGSAPPSAHWAGRRGRSPCRSWRRARRDRPRDTPRAPPAAAVRRATRCALRGRGDAARRLSRFARAPPPIWTKRQARSPGSSASAASKIVIALFFDRPADRQHRDRTRRIAAVAARGARRRRRKAVEIEPVIGQRNPIGGRRQFGQVALPGLGAGHRPLRRRRASRAFPKPGSSRCPWRGPIPTRASPRITAA